MQRVKQPKTLQNPPPPATVRIWARDEDAAERMVRPSDGVPELDGDTYAEDANGADVLPFLTGARVIHCLNCTRWMYAADYIAADHACIPAGHFVGDELDVQATA
jgi:hypothetical protein